MIRLMLFALSLLSLQAAALIEQTDLGVRIAPGFRVTTAATADLAPEVSCMTLDSEARPVVAGAGYIKTLVDRDRDGKFEEGRIFAKPQSAASGLCFDGKSLLFMGAGGLWKYSDANGDGVADGPPEKWLAMNYGERGGQSLRLGPDGWWYLIAEGGRILRLSRDGKEQRLVAEGFGDPSDFDFNGAGDLFTYDAEVERDFFLPWYAPTRLYHVAIGEDHGWTVGNEGLSWTKPEYYADAVDVLAPIGRGVAKGVVSYRHTQFPEEYRDGLFFCDAKSGKIYFAKMQKQGSSYRPRVDLFMEAANGFAPNDIVVEPGGGLLVSIGGRESKAAVYRIEHERERGWSLSELSKVQAVLQAPQPMEAWSRAKWIPVAQQLGADPFRRAIDDANVSEAERLRAVEIYVELFGGLSPGVLETAAVTKLPGVRARIAWAIGRQVTEKSAVVLQRLAQDTDAMVRRCALEAMIDCQEKLNAAAILPIVRQNLDHPDKRLRQAAARLCSRLPEAELKRLWESESALSIQTELSLLLAASWRAQPPEEEERIWRALEALPLARERSLRLQALRVLMIGLSDWNLQKPSAGVFAAYELARPVAEEVSTNALVEVRKIFGNADALGDMEAARLLAMLQDDSPETMRKMGKVFEGMVSPTAVFHYLIVLARLRGEWPESLPPKVAEAIVKLREQLGGRENDGALNWPFRLKEVEAALIQNEPKLAGLLAENKPASP